MKKKDLVFPLLILVAVFVFIYISCIQLFSKEDKKNG